MIALETMIALVVGFFAGLGGYMVLLSRQRRRAKEEAHKILENAQREAEAAKREAVLQGKEEVAKERRTVEETARRNADEIREKERNLDKKESALDARLSKLDQRQGELDAARNRLEKRDRELNDKIAQVDLRQSEMQAKLEQVSGWSREQAKEHLVEMLTSNARIEAARRIKAVEDELREEADTKAKKILSLAMQRVAGEYTTERTVKVVNLPNDKIKGRVIGREGRNIRVFEQLTGADLIVDDTPDAVVVSCHNPMRREIACRTLAELVEDGRIHPGRIEEIFNRISKEIDKEVREAGRKAVLDLGLRKLHPELTYLMGQLKFRTSYTQNILLHSIEVGFMCGIMSVELGMDEMEGRRAGFLHDIGKAVDQEYDGGHAKISGELTKKFGETDLISKACAQHHDDHPESVLGVLVQAADALSAARPGARVETMTSYVSRLDDLERLAADFQGVDKAFAIQAGREVRVMVASERVNDDEAFMIGRDIARKIEETMTYPGQIKVTVLRESRSVAFAK